MAYLKKGGVTKKSILNGKRILAVGDELKVLAVLEKIIYRGCRDCMFDKATTYIEAVERMASWTYDLVILDIMGVRGFDLLELAIKRNFPTALISAHPLTPEVLKRSSEMNVPIYVLKEKLEEFLPFLEGILRYRYSPWWRHPFEKLNRFLIETFESDWEKTTSLIWHD